MMHCETSGLICKGLGFQFSTNTYVRIAESALGVVRMWLWLLISLP